MGSQFLKIFKQAWQFTKVNKFLWAYGLFLILTNLYFSWNPDTQLTTALPSSVSSLIFFVISVGMLILFFRCKTGLIIATKAVLDKQETSVKKSFTVARVFYGRVVIVSLLMVVLIVTLFVLIGGPIILFSQGNHLIQFVILTAIGLVILIPILFIANFIMALAPMFVVVYDLKIWEAIKQSMDLVLSRWLWLFGFGTVLFLVEAISLSLGFLLYFLYHNGSAVSWVLLIIGSLLFLFLLSVVQVFQQAAWVLAFQELIHPEKLSEEEILPAPEVVG